MQPNFQSRPSIGVASPSNFSCKSLADATFYFRFSHESIYEFFRVDKNYSNHPFKVRKENMNITVGILKYEVKFAKSLFTRSFVMSIFFLKQKNKKAFEIFFMQRKQETLWIKDSFNTRLNIITYRDRYFLWLQWKYIWTKKICMMWRDCASKNTRHECIPLFDGSSILAKNKCGT